MPASPGRQKTELVEYDWAKYGFACSWRIQPGRPVNFERYSIPGWKASGESVLFLYFGSEINVVWWAQQEYVWLWYISYTGEQKQTVSYFFCPQRCQGGKLKRIHDPKLDHQQPSQNSRQLPQGLKNDIVFRLLTCNHRNRPGNLRSFFGSPSKTDSTFGEDQRHEGIQGNKLKQFSEVNSKQIREVLHKQFQETWKACWRFWRTPQRL